MAKRALMSLSTVVLLVSSLLQAGTGLLILYEVNPLILGKIHIYNAFLFIALIIVHLGFNATWIQNNWFMQKK